MPRYYCEYCDISLTHSSVPGRKQCAVIIMITTGHSVSALCSHSQVHYSSLLYTGTIQDANTS